MKAIINAGYIRDFGPAGAGYLNNFSGNSPAGGNCTITFSSVQNRVGMETWCNDADNITLTLFNGATQVGQQTFQVNGPAVNGFTWIGMQSAIGFDRVLVDANPGSNGAMGIDNLRFEACAASYDFAWSGPNGYSSNDTVLTALCAGDYNVVVTNQSTGCQEMRTINVPEPDLLVVAMCADTQYVAAAYGPESQALITTTTTGGTAAYSYLWSNGETTDFIYVRPDSTTSYTVVVTDYHGCTATATTVVVVVDVLCPSSKTSKSSKASKASKVEIVLCKTKVKSNKSQSSKASAGSGPKEVCVKASQVSALLNPSVGSKSSAKSQKSIYRLGPCDFSGSFDNDDCGEPVWYECGCDGGLASLTVSYSGGAGQVVSAGNKHAVADNGDGTYTITAVSSKSSKASKSGSGCNKLKSSITLTGGASIHTSCSQPIGPGMVFGDYTVVSFTDCDGNYCQKQVTDKLLVVDPASVNTDANAAVAAVNGVTFEAMPNPFATSTTIKFTTEVDDYVTLVVYSTNSTEVSTLFEGAVKADKTYEIEFNPADKASGLYISKLIMRSGTTLHQKLVMTR
jgi:hypothetical protein